MRLCSGKAYHGGLAGALVGGILAALWLTPAAAQPDIRVLVNGTPVDFHGAAPEQANNRVLVPLRGVFEAMGAQVEYHPAAGRISAARGDTRVELTIGSLHATVNGQDRTLDVPAQLHSDRTLVPLRFVSEALGAEVHWDEAQRAVSIADAAVPPPPGPSGRGPEWFISLTSVPPGAEVYLVSEYDWETIPDVVHRIDEDPDLATDQVSEGPTDVEVPRPLIVYRAVFIWHGARQTAPVQPIPILAGQKRQSSVHF